ncbi:MAG: hypothetical protein WCP10_01805 [Desulfuromonadales bacterium]
MVDAAAETGELERLLEDVRKTICDNRRFLDKLLDDATESGTVEVGEDGAPVDEEFEEL